MFDKEVQCSPLPYAGKTHSDAVDMTALTDDVANDEYWKMLAKERQAALSDTLEENKSLCELIDVRSQEVNELTVQK